VLATTQATYPLETLMPPAQLNSLAFSQNFRSQSHLAGMAAVGYAERWRAWGGSNLPLQWIRPKVLGRFWLAAGPA